MQTLLNCNVCDELFRTRTSLNNHVRRVHQSCVNIKFGNGQFKEVHKGMDGTFLCECGRKFKHPISLRSHAKKCNGHSELDYNIDDLSSSEILIDEITEELGDCIGNRIEFGGIY